MAKEVRFPLKKEILIWAIKEAQVDEDEVLRKFTKLEKWIDGEENPTLFKDTIWLYVFRKTSYC
mgnify:CR=1 FL=1